MTECDGLFFISREVKCVLRLKNGTYEMDAHVARSKMRDFKSSTHSSVENGETFFFFFE